MEHFLGLPPVGSEHGPGIDHSIGVIHWLMLVLFAGWFAYYLITLLRFRKSKNPSASYLGAKSNFAIYAAGLVAVFELGMLFTVDAPLWARRVTNFPSAPAATEIRIVAEQFSWNIHYPGNDGKFGKTSMNLIDADNPLGLDRNDPDAKDDITAINQLYLPVNKPVLIHLSSKDVIHSLNLPLFRVKQDAIPGMSIPVWFIPTKTTNEIRQELRQQFSVAGAMSKIAKLVLPEVRNIHLSRGDKMGDMILMKDYPDASGGVAASKGERLDTSVVGRLSEAGVTEITARKAAEFDAYISMEEHKDNGGNVLVGKNETLTEEAITKLLESEVKEISGRHSSNIDPYVVMESYSDKAGTSIVQAGEPLSEEIISKLAEAGISEITLAPATPTEIACAQLCGLGHYRMRGYMNVVTPEEFTKWCNEQEAAINPPATASDASQATPETISGSQAK